MHWFSGSCPVGTFVQVPSEPAMAHDWQAAAQGPAQQTPCWHWLVMHSLLAAQATPVGFLVQTPITQTLGAAHSASAVHDVRHTLVAQVYVPHDDGVVV